MGSLVKRERIRKGIETIELANMIGAHRETIYLLERDVKIPGFEYLKKIGEVLDIDICKYDEMYRFSSNIDANLAAIAKNLNMNYKELAEYVGINANNIYKWKYGHKNISRKFFETLKEKLGSDLHIE